MAPADRGARRSRRGVGDRGCRRRPGIGDHAGGRRATHRGRRPIASLPPSADPVGDPAARDGRGAEAAHVALAGVVGDFDRAAWHRAAATDTARRIGGRAARRRGRSGDPARRAPVAVAALQRAATLSADGRARGTRLLRAADVANEIGHMDVIAQMLAEAEPIDVPALEDRRQAWITALSLSGPRSPREKANLRSVVAAAQRAGEDGQDDLGLALLQFASARSWWLDPGLEIRSQIAAAARQLGGPDRRPRHLPELDRARGPRRRAARPARRAREVGGARQWERRTAIRDGRPLAGRAGPCRRLLQRLDRRPPQGGPAGPARPVLDDPRVRLRASRDAGDRGLRPRRGLAGSGSRPGSRSTSRPPT